MIEISDLGLFVVRGKIFKTNYMRQPNEQHANESISMQFAACLFVPPSKVQRSQGRSNCYKYNNNDPFYCVGTNRSDYIIKIESASFCDVARM